MRSGQRSDGRERELRVAQLDARRVEHKARVPARRRAREPSRLLFADEQRQRESVRNAEVPELASGCFGRGKVPALDRALEVRVRVALVA